VEIYGYYTLPHNNVIIVLYEQVPQVMEVVGLGFTIWFTSRYLIFKVSCFALLELSVLFMSQILTFRLPSEQENRDELITRVTSIKKQILGSHDG
jgi:hypothetical protein